MAPVGLNVKSKAYYISKFTKEIIRMWSGLPVPKATKANEILSKELMMEVLVKLGYIDDASSSSLRTRSKSASRLSSLYFQENARNEKE